MLHRKILDPVLALLDGERAVYFQGIAEKLDADPRAEQAPNLVYLVLKESIPFLPIYLDVDQIITQLLKFVGDNRVALNRILYSRAYIEDPESIKQITDKFVAVILSATLEKYEDGQIETGEQKIYRVSWPYTDVAFPYVDPDED
ncbi:MAG: hypothetical protein HQ483_12505 [Rhodospirillales bacterium]|nr:hypothetical protein [Rhodospirillales bacterium]